MYLHSDLGQYTHDVQENCPISKTPQLRPKFFQPLDLGRPISKQPAPSSNDNQSIKGKIILGWLLYVIIKCFLQVSFRFQYQLTILSPATSLHSAEANLVPRAISKNIKPLFRLPLIVKRCAGVKVELKRHYLLCHGFTFLCVQLSKNMKCFLKKCFF